MMACWCTHGWKTAHCALERNFLLHNLSSSSLRIFPQEVRVSHLENKFWDRDGISKLSCRYFQQRQIFEMVLERFWDGSRWNWILIVLRDACGSQRVSWQYCVFFLIFYFTILDFSARSISCNYLRNKIVPECANRWRFFNSLMIYLMWSIKSILDFSHSK